MHNVYDMPSDNEVKAQLKRLLMSAELRGSVRMSKFISYVVKKTLKGEQDNIKGYTLGVDVFEKAPDFNPDIDASVRVAAARLRKSLRLYYLGEGSNDPILIDMPKGGYKVVFSYRAGAKDTSLKHSQKAEKLNVMSVIKQHKIAFWAGCSFVLMICIAFYVLHLLIREFGGV